MPDITIPGPDGDFGAYLALPETTPAPAVVVIQEIFGVNQVMRDLCDAYARAGYVAICPDLFWRIEPGIQITDKTEEEWQQAFDLFGKFDVEKGVEDLKTTLGHIREHDACNGRVGDVGYCLGGKMAFLMATRSDADASVSYYGVGLNELVGEKDKITKPTLLHIASEDEFVPKDAQEAVKSALKDHPEVEIFVYEGNNHAFAREGGAHYDPAAADLANKRTMDFFKQHLS
jgi:carboxymethylenebutenolidase